MKEFIVNANDDGIRLDRWFKRHYSNVPFALIAKQTRKGQIKLNGKKTDISTKISEGDVIKFKEFIVDETFEAPKRIPEYLEKEMQENIIFMDNNIIALAKPHGLAVQGGTGIKFSVDDLSEFLKFDAPEKPKLVHRLDKDTSGVLVLARNAKTAAGLSELFRSRNIKKTYLALVDGLPRPLSGKIDIPLDKARGEEFERVEKGQKQSVTFYEVLDRAADRAALVKLNLITGRTHQIRAHMSMIGHPLLGDDKYGKRENMISTIDDKLYLHSFSIAFKYNGKSYNFEAPLPKHFKDAVKTLGLSLDKKWQK